ncbi:MAG: hypothetical protein Q8S73_44555 [Deltaproteobacteria bacterium]|nr:hypothetical protein [Myxococcales bacterium]MDP3221238.1 hypothetical protein [Deltaproteobacteria bacterium]
MPRAAVVPALLVALAFPAGALGDPVPASVRLAWVRGADADACPDGAWLRREVARRLRRDPFDDDGPRSFEAVVERASPGWRATLRVRDREGTLLGERTLTHDAERCDPIADASALAVALAVDPDALIDEPARTDASPPPAPPPPPAEAATTEGATTEGATTGGGAPGGPVAGAGNTRWGKRRDHPVARPDRRPRRSGGALPAVERAAAGRPGALALVGRPGDRVRVHPGDGAGVRRAVALGVVGAHRVRGALRGAGARCGAQRAGARRGLPENGWHLSTGDIDGWSRASTHACGPQASPSEGSIRELPTRSIVATAAAALKEKNRKGRKGRKGKFCQR